MRGTRLFAFFLLCAATSPVFAQPGTAVGLQTPLPAAPPESCDAPADLTQTDAHFQSVADALKQGHALDVLAIGSATMLGPDRSTDTSFPAVMVATVRSAVPGASVALTVRSGRGMTAADMVPLLREAFARHRYQLVIWQTGTVESVRGLPPDDFLQTLSTGVQIARDGGADVVLVDPQFSRFLRANANLDPYLQVMRQAAALGNAVLLPRFDLMKDWVDAGRLDMERAERPHREAVARSVHACLGRALAGLVLQAAGLRQP